MEFLLHIYFRKIKPVDYLFYATLEMTHVLKKEIDCFQLLHIVSSILVRKNDDIVLFGSSTNTYMRTYRVC